MKIRTLIRCIGFDNERGEVLFVVPSLSSTEIIRVPIAECPDTIRLETDLRLHAQVTFIAARTAAFSELEWDGLSAREQKDRIADFVYEQLQGPERSLG